MVLSKCPRCASQDPARPEKLEKRQRIVPLGPKQTFLTRQKRSSNSLTLKCNPKARGFVYSKARSTAGRKLVSQCSPAHGSGRHGGWGAEWEPRGPTWRGACPPHPPLQRDTKQCKARRVSLLSEVQFGGAAVRSIGCTSRGAIPSQPCNPFVCEPPGKSLTLNPNFVSTSHTSPEQLGCWWQSSPRWGLGERWRVTDNELTFLSGMTTVFYR